MRRLTERCEQRAQPGEAVGSNQPAENQLAQRFFDHARQQTRTQNDIHEE